MSGLPVRDRAVNYHAARRESRLRFSRVRDVAHKRGGGLSLGRAHTFRACDRELDPSARGVIHHRLAQTVIKISVRFARPLEGRILGR